MYSTELGHWKTINNKHTGVHTVPVDQIAKWSARNQFTVWLENEVSCEDTSAYLEAARNHRYSYELDVARLAIDLAKIAETLKEDPLVNKGLRAQLTARGVDHRKLSQWRIVSSVYIAEEMTGISLTSEVLRKDPPVVNKH